jgi:superfamily II DNA or RNA helicase
LKQLFYVTNPSKIRAVACLVKFHEERGVKIIVFSDFIYSLKLYAQLFKKPLVYGETPERERAAILRTFCASDANRTIYISKAGDISIDLPEANVIGIGTYLASQILHPTRGKSQQLHCFLLLSAASTDTQENVLFCKTTTVFS